uniref:Uncharacterized protein n=1 Tax=Solanum tuberosum TaxID=4113 RepID=M1C8M1_SOLTU
MRSISLAPLLAAPPSSPAAGCCRLLSLVGAGVISRLNEKGGNEGRERGERATGSGERKLSPAMDGLVGGAT